MPENQNIGATEARIGLTLITCLLVTLGYVVVERLSDAHHSPTALPVQATYGETLGHTDPGVVTAMGIAAEAPAEHQASYAPQWLEPQPPQPSASFTR